MTAGIQTNERPLLPPLVDSLTGDVQMLGHLVDRKRSAFEREQSLALEQSSKPGGPEGIVGLQPLDRVGLLEHAYDDFDVA